MSSNIEERLIALEERLSELGYDSKKIVDASIKRKFKLENQSQMLYAPLVAFCVSTIDPLALNRVRVYHPLLCEPDVKIKGLPFARACSNQGGFDDSGCSWVPPAGSSVLIVCENGDRRSPIYLGTVWHKNRGPNGSLFPYPIDEFFKLWREVENGQVTYRGAGYLLGAKDGSQCFPPFDTENKNGINYDSDTDIDRDPDAQLKITYPNIYGWKTPGKHMFKMVDGDHRCNNRWSRMEWMSKTGNIMLFKDDWYNPSGEWANPKGVGDSPTGTVDDSDCDKVSALLSLDVSGVEDGSGNFSGQQTGTGADFAGSDVTTCGSSSTPVRASNPYSKRLEECRFYKGAPTPQNNKCALPQSGIQIQCVSGHQIVMDDSVNQPREKKINWQRDFDFGCDNIYKGKFYFKSATGHMIEINDTEDVAQIRGQNNGINLRTAAGNSLVLSDHTLEGCIAGKKRGVKLGSTSGHALEMSDSGNEQCSPTRKEGGVPASRAREAFVQLRSGYGLVFRLDDGTSQEETTNQFIMLAARPKKQNTDNCSSQPHTLLMQLESDGGGFVELASGGKFIVTTRADSLESVGTEDCPASKINQIFGNYLVSAKGIYFTKSSVHIDMADKYIILGAGQDCSMDDQTAESQAEEATASADATVQAAENTGTSQQSKGPCIFPIIIARNPQVCPLTGFIHWMQYSNRVLASSG